MSVATVTPPMPGATHHSHPAHSPRHEVTSPTVHHKYRGRAFVEESLTVAYGYLRVLSSSSLAKISQSRPLLVSDFEVIVLTVNPDTCGPEKSRITQFKVRFHTDLGMKVYPTVHGMMDLLSAHEHCTHLKRSAKAVESLQTNPSGVCITYDNFKGATGLTYLLEPSKVVLSMEQI